jgi:hypothetical protein
MSFLRSEFRVEGSRVEDKGPSVSVIRHLISVICHLTPALVKYPQDTTLELFQIIPA